MLAPLRSVKDRRFPWLCDVFPKSFPDWQNFFQQCQGNFTKHSGQKMFIPWQTYEGLKTNINSIIQTTQFLLWHQVNNVLTELFCQDPLENWFSRQISFGLRKDNASMVDFEYNNNPIRNQKNLKPIANDNAVDSGMIALTDKPLLCWKPKKEWKYKCKSWINSSIAASPKI